MAGLRRLADRVLEAPDAQAVGQILTRALPEILGVREASLLLWNRKLDHFEFATPGETRVEPLGSAAGPPPPEARHLIADGVLVATPEGGADGTLVPLLARSGLVGTLVLGPRPRRRKVPYDPAEVRALSVLAQRAALALENTLYQRELIDSERMSALGTMAGMLAHDFRGPMTVIRGYAETLIEGPLPADQVRQRALLMIQMIDRLERMTRETLDFARVGGRLARRVVTLGPFLREMVQGLGQEFPGLEADLVLQLPPEETAALDIDKLRRAVSNVAANARDAMGGKGRFHVIATRQGDRLVLTLADEGPGVPADLRDRIFDAFVTQGKKGGTGLGLAVARRFVEDHGGTIELVSEGTGARFRITIPLGAPAPSVTAQTA